MKAIHATVVGWLRRPLVHGIDPLHNETTRILPLDRPIDTALVLVSGLNIMLAWGGVRSRHAAVKIPLVPRWAALILLWGGTQLYAQDRGGSDSTELITLRLIHPERQAADFLRLFEGSPAPHPAAALASWKQVSGEPAKLGKPTEAILSFFNPDMVGELRSFHDSRLVVGLAPDTGSLWWTWFVPKDDGSLDAMITSLRLSGGDAEAPLGGGRIGVDRLGGPGKAVAARGPHGVVLASSRAELERALDGRARSNDPIGIAELPGLFFRINPSRFAGAAVGSLTTRRLIEAARGLGCLSIECWAHLHNGGLELETRTRTDRGQPVGPRANKRRAIELEWLTWMPASRAGALLCLTTGEGAAYWDRVFALADRVDRSDPARAQLAPLRSRVNLLATAAGVRLEADFWPHLRGLTIGLLTNPDKPGELAGALVALHMDQEAAAAELVKGVLPRLVSLRGGLKSPGPGVSAPGDFGKVGGRSLAALVRGRTVLVGWGEGTITTMLQSHDHPDRSVLPIIGSYFKNHPDRLGAFWPGRIRLPIKGLDGSTPLERSLAEGPPIVWVGWNEEEFARDLVVWPELRPTIHRFLALIPLDPVMTP
jgi:hypothetical protein